MSEQSNQKKKEESTHTGRRGFLKFGLLAAGLTAVTGGLQEALAEDKTEAIKTDGEKVKMLTPDGKLVEVDKAFLAQISNKKKASNSDIYNWMNNPSKDNTL